MKLALLSRLLLLSLGLVCCYTSAHPHSWIDLKTEFILDDKHQLVAIKQRWVFDTYYSVIKLADISNEHADQQSGLAYVAKDMAKNLRGYGYFSELIIDSQSIVLPEPDESVLTTIFQKGQQQLVLTMNFAFDSAVVLHKKVLSWRVFDPTYYIDMRHHTLSQIVIRQPPNIECSTQLNIPTPSDELINYASSLDRTQKDTQGLGAHFAETVHIHCP